MDDQKYVTRLMRARCSKGTMENYLNVDIDHGIVVGADVQPLMNANDHVSGRHVIHFGCCESDQNPERMFRKALVGGFLGGVIADALEDVGIMTCKCKPNTPNPWEFVNEDSIVEGAPALMVCSTLTCRYGGVIEIIDPDGDGSIDIEEGGTTDEMETNPEGWDEISRMFPELEDDIQKALQDAGDIVGIKSGTSHEYTATLPDGTTITLSTSFAIKAGNTDLLTLESNIKTAIAEQVWALKGKKWSIDDKGSIKSTISGGETSVKVSMNPSTLEMSVGVKIGQDTSLNEYTKLRTPTFGIAANAFGQFSFSTEIGLDTDTPAYTVASTLTAKKPIDNKPKLVSELALANIPAVEVANTFASSAEPWIEKGWNWVCDTASNVANGANNLLKEASEVANNIHDNIVEGINNISTGVQNATNAAGKFVSGVCDNVGAWWNNGGREAVQTGVLIGGSIIVGGVVIATVAPGILAGLSTLAPLALAAA